MKPRLLIVDDEPKIRLALSAYLEKSGFAVYGAGSLSEARQAVVSEAVHCVLLDLKLPDGNGLDWIGELCLVRPSTAVVVITGAGDVPLAVEAMRRGADHFLTKPVDMGELLVFLRKSLEAGELRRGRVLQRRLSKQTSFLFGERAVMRTLRELTEAAARSESPVLLLGETGTGKGVLAQTIHEMSARSGMPFVEVNCACLRGELLASELFGHARGAFTSASADRDGLLDLADGGTLFLDEVGELDPGLQSQFLNVLENKRYRRLGEVRERQSDFRVLCATNRNLARDVETGHFRRDLYFRINVFPVHLPPLRERPEDLPALVHFFLQDLGTRPDAISSEAMAILGRYEWPGNIRELRNVLERALILSQGAPVEAQHLSWLSESPNPPSNRPPERNADPEALRIQKALELHRGKVGEAARSLGLSRASLYRRLQQFGLTPGRKGAAPTSPPAGQPRD